MQDIAATTRCRVIESDLQIVIPKEPVECRPRFLPPMAFPRGAVRLQACTDDCASFNWLLIEARCSRFLRVKALRTDRHKMAVSLAPLKREHPVKRFETRRDHPVIARAHPSPNQGLWKA